MEKFYESYPGTVALLVLILTFLGVVTPGVTAVMKSKRAKRDHRPAPRRGRWAAWVLRSASKIKAVAIRLKTDPEIANGEIRVQAAKIVALERRLGLVRNQRDNAQALRDRNSELETALVLANADIDNLRKELVRVRGMDAVANEKALAGEYVPEATWRIRHIAGRAMELTNVGSGTATGVQIKTNFPKEVTLSDAFVKQAGPGCIKYFDIEPQSFLDNLDLEFIISWQNEAGRVQKEVKKSL